MELRKRKKRRSAVGWVDGLTWWRDQRQTPGWVQKLYVKSLYACRKYLYFGIAIYTYIIWSCLNEF